MRTPRPFFAHMFKAFAVVKKSYIFLKRHILIVMGLAIVLGVGYSFVHNNNVIKHQIESKRELSAMKKSEQVRQQMKDLHLQ